MVITSQHIKESASARKLLESAKPLFYKYGFRKVTISEICKDAGISKMTFYRFFSNKTEIVVCILIEMAAAGMKDYYDIMDSDVTFEEKIMATMRMKTLAANQYSEEFLKDVYTEPTGEIMSLLKALADKAMAVVMADYRIAQEAGHIRKDLNLALIPYFTNEVTRMINDPVLLQLYGGNVHDAIRDLSGLFFYGILSPDARSK